MRYASVCSGIEAATVAWHPLGWTPIFFSEIDPFACALLEQRYPSVQNHGDMTHFHDWPDADIDVLVGGTPCQSFSLAGSRAGLADPRGNLAVTFLAIADRYRPDWLVWENVPGVLYSRGGRDFATFLGCLGELGYGWAYRVLDAQYFGVPQRRRRVFVVGCARGWTRAAAVLFELPSLRGDPPPCRPSRQSSPGASSLVADCGGKERIAFDWQIGGDHKTSWPIEEDMTPTLLARGGIAVAEFGEPDSFGPRRLTPTEFERLQGFPDDYTMIKFCRKPAPDGRRYRAIGNSMPVTVMRWIGQRIEIVESVLLELAA